MLVPWPLPANLSTEAKRRARLLLADATGPVLDLGGSTSPIACGDWGTARTIDVTSLSNVFDPTAAVEGLATRRGRGTFAEISSVVVTPYVRDLPRLFSAVADLLDEDGRLLFVEPDSTRSTWNSLAAPAMKSVTGLELGRDITGAMWDSGLSVARIDRQPVARLSWPLRQLVSGVAGPVSRDDNRSRRN
jgi:hypothetical protein